MIATVSPCLEIVGALVVPPWIHCIRGSTPSVARMCRDKCSNLHFAIAQLPYGAAACLCQSVMACMLHLHAHGRIQQKKGMPRAPRRCRRTACHKAPAASRSACPRCLAAACTAPGCRCRQVHPGTDRRHWPRRPSRSWSPAGPGSTAGGGVAVRCAMAGIGWPAGQPFGHVVTRYNTVQGLPWQACCACSRRYGDWAGKSLWARVTASAASAARRRA
jgi:hypothetical protein